MGRDDMDKGEVVWAEQDDAEAEGGRGGLGGGLLALESIGLLNQGAEIGGTTLVDACNGLDCLIHLEMICMVQHC